MSNLLNRIQIPWKLRYSVGVLHRAIVTHGGSGSNPDDSDGSNSAARIGMDLLNSGESALDAVIKAVRYLEDDPRFNAGIGSRIRADGITIQQDASCMTSNGKFGAVACVPGIRNPIDIAHGVLLHSPHILITGEGCRIFSKEQNINLLPLEKANSSEPEIHQASTYCDTVGAVAYDGSTFAAALSSGGLENAAVGRVGDVPLPGCGLFCGPLGSVACTGDGEYIALRNLAREVYAMLENHISPREAADKVLTLFNTSVDIGIIILSQENYASSSRNGMAWSHLTESE